jgi:hypothetical protein
MSSMRPAALALLLLLCGATAPAAARGPSTPEERTEIVALARRLETTPWTEEARQARGRLTRLLGEVPDLTVKYCLSLLGSAVERQGIPQDLLQQHLFSSAAYLIEHPGTAAGSTETLLAGVAGTLAAYEALKAHQPGAEHPRLEELLHLRSGGELEPYVRARGRNCR